ncbi:ATP-dependent helicase [candidate division KSB3 bacterium]|uniref:ATP-dependent helicase n=1 Tax=candidate division KSB3 bacterium TaxID=2044937 RepID=A0A9D5Q6H3_9BACT|nr:ATP-dependent helicase [candidate division KSB3 bacterium]MBD3325844.1 ATP-dependent helicase [candidate division KSB3 bacterium]
MAKEWIEWLEISQPTARQPHASQDRVDVSSKRCPRCGWLDQRSVSECFRCGYDYLTGDLHTDYFQNHPIGIPAPTIQTVNFEDWKFKTPQPRPLKASAGAAPSVATPDAQASDPLTAFFLRLQAEHLRLVQGFETLIALDDLDILHYEHQLQAALTALNTMRGQALLADEVGLGKTIEAGIILKELSRRRLIRRILIITPASLMKQWQDELMTKFGEEFLIASKEEDWLQDKVITSFSRLRLPKKPQRTAHGERSPVEGGAQAMLTQDYDLLIIDEAHKLKHRATQRYKFVSKIKKKYVLMLTATPVHNNLTELYNLITILKPGLLGTVRSFKRHFVASSDARRPKNEQYLKQILANVMIRNRRSDVNITFPDRHSAIYHLDLTDEERQLYTAVSEYIRHEFKAQTKHQYHLLSLTTLQKELCSSSRAVRLTLQKMADRSHYPDAVRARLREFIALANAVTRNRKIEALKEILENFPGKFLIFTEFLQTMHYIQEHLEAAGIQTQLFHGGLNFLQRTDAIRNFERSARVLISTQTGGEGFNLQFCHQLINYDLPWNPMMVEQRIGRLHRLGQQHDVLIFNFSVRDTIEAHVLDLLSRKIRMFELVVGELDLILSEIEDKKTFEHRIQEIWLTSKNDHDMRQRFDRFGERLIHARKGFDKHKEAEILTSELFEECPLRTP